jgi:hypothetical protein
MFESTVAIALPRSLSRPSRFLPRFGMDVKQSRPGSERLGKPACRTRKK